MNECDHGLKIYVAGAYTATTQREIEKNVRVAIDVGIALFERGHFPFIPHLSHYIDKRADETNNHLTWEDYMLRDLAWLEVSDALFFIGKSRGALIELEAARFWDLDIYYTVSEVPTVRRVSNQNKMTEFERGREEGYEEAIREFRPPDL